MQRTRSRALWFLVGLVLAASSPGAAQDWGQPWADPQDRPPRVDISASVGLLAPTDWSDLVLLGSISPTSGVLEQVLVRDLRVRTDREFGAAVTYWRGRYGFRVQGGFSSSAVHIGGPPDTADLASVDVDTWLYDIGGAIGFVEYAPERWVWPYAFFGVGGITYDLAQRVGPPLLTFIQREPSRPAGRGDLVVLDDASRNFLLAVDELDAETVFAANIGVGTDIRLPMAAGGIGLRVEVADHIASSPVGLRIAELRRSNSLTSDTGVRFSLVHHLRVAAGFVVQFGR